MNTQNESEDQHEHYSSLSCSPHIFVQDNNPCQNALLCNYIEFDHQHKKPIPMPSLGKIKFYFS